MEFGDIDGTNLSVIGLPIPTPLFTLLHKQDIVAAEKWLRNNNDHPSLQPYRVTLMIQENRFSTDLKPVSYFLRGPRIDPDLADNPFNRTTQAGYSSDPREMAEAADRLWTHWEKPKTVDGGQPAQFPDSVDVADVVEIDLGDWDGYLKDAQKHARDNNPYKCIGAPRYPLYWTCVGMAFLDDQELHQHPDYDALDAFARMPGFDTRGKPID
jgi:hypothetical protein